MTRMADLLVDHGCMDEAEIWYHRAIDAEGTEATYAMRRLAKLLASQGRVEEAEIWYHRAIDAEGTEATYAMGGLADLLASQGRVDEAVEWYQQAAAIGSIFAMSQLAALLAKQSRADEAKEWEDRAHEAFWREVKREENKFGGWWRLAAAPDWDAIVTTAVVTAALMPFVQTLAAKAAEDAYEAVRTLLHRLFREHRTNGSGEQSRRDAAIGVLIVEKHGTDTPEDRDELQYDGYGERRLLIVEDPDTRVALHLWGNVPDDAICALVALDLTRLPSCPARMGESISSGTTVPDLGSS